MSLEIGLEFKGVILSRLTLLFLFQGFNKKTVSNYVQSPIPFISLIFFLLELMVPSCSLSQIWSPKLVRKTIWLMGNISQCLGKEELVRWCEIQPWDSYLWQVILFVNKNICAHSYPLLYNLNTEFC